MKISDIVIKINQNLAEEMLPISRIKALCDDIIDDINENLCSKFPSFTEFCNAHIRTDGTLDMDADYNFFPDKYIRHVLCKGAAYLYYVLDEEGNMSAQMLGYKYDDAMFTMVRDYIALVPVAYQDTDTIGSQGMSDNLNPAANPVPLDIWSW